VVGELKIIAPGGSSLWWVASSANTLIWDCTDKTHDQFNVVISNPNVNVLTAPLTIIPTLPNYVCSKLITAQQISLPAATGYVVSLTNIFNNSDIYASSQPFEIKALGSAYPDPSATPGSGGSSSRSPSGTSSGANPSSTSNGNSSNNSGGSKNVLNAIGAFAAVVLGVMTT
jgi:hypothetical protein